MIRIEFNKDFENSEEVALFFGALLKVEPVVAINRSDLY